MKKRLFIIVLTLLAMLLTGCSGDKTSSSEAEPEVSSKAHSSAPCDDTGLDSSPLSEESAKSDSPASESNTPEASASNLPLDVKIYWNEFLDGEFPHNVNSRVYEETNTWVQEGDSWYYLNQYGIKAAGWLDNNGKRYYMEPSGAMYTGWKYIAGSNYYFDSKDGHMLCSTTLEVDNTLYSFDNLGRLSTEVWVSDELGSYYIKSDGYRCSNGFFFIGTDTYYANSDGYIVTSSWITVDGSTYYFQADGKMAQNTIIDGKEVDYLGRLIQ